MGTVYEWDSNCQIIYDNLAGALNHVLAETGQLEHDTYPQTPYDYLNYYKKWHYNNELYKITRFEIISRFETINELVKQGFGVSLALADSLCDLINKQCRWCAAALDYTFDLRIVELSKLIYLSNHTVENRNSRYIISQLSRNLNINEEDNLPSPIVEENNIPAYLNSFFHLSRITPPSAHIALLLKMFLSITEASDTIMSGFIGEKNVDSPQLIKLIASDNVRNLFYNLYNNFDTINNIDLNLIKAVHSNLTNDLNHSHNWEPGEIRNEDFFDKNGLTIEFGNFEKGMRELEYFLNSANWNTDSFDQFTNHLVYLYYLFISIHPFIDSNGRTARSVVNFLMLKRGLCPVIFNSFIEIQALPRYGGSILKMKEYFESRIKYSMDYYFREVNRLNNLNLLESDFYNINFDSGLYFTQLKSHFSAIEVSFKIYEVTPEHPAYYFYETRSMITTSSYEEVKKTFLHGGFLTENSGDWHNARNFGLDFIRFKEKDHNGIGVWEVAILIPLNEYDSDFYAFESVIFSGKKIFNNKGLNYRYILNK